MTVTCQNSALPKNIYIKLDKIRFYRICQAKFTQVSADYPLNTVWGFMLTSAFTRNKMEYGWHQLPTIECLEKPSNRILLANAEPEKMSWMDSPSHTPRNEAGTGIYLHVAPSSDPLHLAGCVPSVASSPSLPLWRLSTYLKEPGDNSWESGWV